MKSHSYILYITYTGLLIGLALAFQSLRFLVPSVAFLGIFNTQQIITGSLVNLTLIIAAWMVGFWSGAAVSVLTALVAYVQGGMPPVPAMIAAVALGNLTLVTIVWLLRERRLIGVIAGAAVKFGVLFLLVTYLVIPLFVEKEPIRKALAAGFSWPQLATAGIAGILALIIYPPLSRSMKKP